MTSHSEIARILKKKYGFFPLNITFLPSGQGEVFEIETREKTYILKKYYSKNLIVSRLRIFETIRLLNFLKKKKFNYNFPLILKNVRGEYLLNFKDGSGVLYQKITGKLITKPNFQQIKEIAKILALFHKTTDSFKINKDIIRFHKFLKLKNLREYDYLKNSSLKNKNIFLINLPLIKKAFTFARKNISYSDFGVIHSDINLNNLIFDHGRIKGLIDFENYNYAPRIFDLAYSIKMTCFKEDQIDFKKLELFLKNYNHYHNLPKNFNRDLLLAILLDHCIYFFRAYEKEKTSELFATIKLIKALFKEVSDAKGYEQTVTLIKSLK